MSKLEVVSSEDGVNLPPLGTPEQGSEFGFYDRLFMGWRDGKVFDYNDWEARDIWEMLKKDYKARQIENVISQPILSATTSIIPAKGDTGEADWMNNYWDDDEYNGGCETTLHELISQMTSAFSYKKAYFELMWNHGHDDYDGKIVLDKIGFRPATTCRAMRDPRNGGLLGFEQEPYYVGPEITKGTFPIEIPSKRAFVYIHGTRRDPLNGSSDMEIPYWCYKTKQKLLFLWFQFLEGVSLPRTIVLAQDEGQAKQIAQQVARLKSSGVLPIGTPAGPDSVKVTTLDLSGKGDAQFTAAIAWLDKAATDSVLAGFLDLTGNAVNGLRGATGFGGGGGSFALSKDQSNFFLQSEEAKTREMEYAVRRGIFAPLARYNFGKSARIPKLKFEPLNDEDKTNSLTLLQGMIASPNNHATVPGEFIAALAQQSGDYLGLDGASLAQAFQKASDDAAAQAAALGASQMGQQVAGAAGAVDAASMTVMHAKTPTAGSAALPTKPGTPPPTATAPAGLDHNILPPAIEAFRK